MSCVASFSSFGRRSGLLNHLYGGPCIYIEVSPSDRRWGQLQPFVPLCDSSHRTHFDNLKSINPRGYIYMGDIHVHLSLIIGWGHFPFLHINPPCVLEIPLLYLKNLIYGSIRHLWWGIDALEYFSIYIYIYILNEQIKLLYSIRVSVVILYLHHSMNIWIRYAWMQIYFYGVLVISSIMFFFFSFFARFGFILQFPTWDS